MTRKQIQKTIEDVIKEEAEGYISSTDLFTSYDAEFLAEEAAKRIMNLWDQGFTYELIR